MAEGELKPRRRLPCRQCSLYPWGCSKPNGTWPRVATLAFFQGHTGRPWALGSGAGGSGAAGLRERVSGGSQGARMGKAKASCRRGQDGFWARTCSLCGWLPGDGDWRETLAHVKCVCTCAVVAHHGSGRRGQREGRSCRASPGSVRCGGVGCRVDLKVTVTSDLPQVLCHRSSILRLLSSSPFSVPAAREPPPSISLIKICICPGVKETISVPRDFRPGFSFPSWCVCQEQVRFLPRGCI